MSLAVYYPKYHLCKTAKTVDVATTDTSVRFTSLLAKIAEAITTGTRTKGKRE